MMKLGEFDLATDRFVQLIDCGHVFEVAGLDSWMNQQGQANTVQLPHCPNCRTPIRQTYRYGNVVKQKLQDIEGVKNRLSEQHRQLKRAIQQAKKHATELIETLNKGRPNEDDAMQQMHELKRLFERRIDKEQFQVIQQKINIMANLVWLRRKIVKRAKAPLVYTIPLEKLRTAILDSRVELPALLAKVRELYLVMLDFFEHLDKLEPGQLQPADHVSLRDIISELQSNRQPNTDDVERWSTVIEQLKPKLFGVSKKTLQLVIQAMAREGGSNHWFKCPNGHLYFIGECGGAMQVGQCPDCHALVGGQQHRLLGDNQHAGIDGTAPSWPQ